MEPIGDTPTQCIVPQQDNALQFISKNLRLENPEDEDQIRLIKRLIGCLAFICDFEKNDCIQPLFSEQVNSKGEGTVLLYGYLPPGGGFAFTIAKYAIHGEPHWITTVQFGSAEAIGHDKTITQLSVQPLGGVWWRSNAEAIRKAHDTALQMLKTAVSQGPTIYQHFAIDYSPYYYSQTFT